MNLNILGTEYEYLRDDLNNRSLAEADGYCEIYDKKICVRKKEYLAGDSDAAKQLREDHVNRHELLHAVAEETGVNYGNDENLIDWIAHVIPIVNKLFEQIKESGD